MVCNSNFRDGMLYMLDMKKIGASDYVKQFYNRMFVLENDVVELLKEYLAYGDYKYGREDVREYLAGYIANNNDAYITRDNGFRERFKEMRLGDKVRLYMHTTGKDIDDIIELARPRKK